MINFKILKNYDISSGIILLIISLFLLFEIRLSNFSDISTGEDAIGPKSAPTYLNITIMLLSALLIFNCMFNKENIIKHNSKFNFSLVFKKVQLIAAAFLYLLLTNLVGYLLSTFIIIPLLLSIFQNKNIKKNLFISFVGSLIYYIFFIKILGLHSPDSQIEFFEMLNF